MMEKAAAAMIQDFLYADMKSVHLVYDFSGAYLAYFIMYRFLKSHFFSRYNCIITTFNK